MTARHPIPLPNLAKSFPRPVRPPYPLQHQVQDLVAERAQREEEDGEASGEDKEGEIGYEEEDGRQGQESEGD
jgi:hypothetical protein